MDLVIAIDASGSINEQNFPVMLNFVKDLVKNLDVDSGRIRVAVLTFSNEPRIEFFLDEYDSRMQMMGAIDQIDYTRGTTNTAGTLQYIRSTVLTQQYGDRSNVRDFLILLTDGESDDNEASLQQAKLLRGDGVHIMTVGIGSWLDVYELQAMASYPYQENMIEVGNFTDLQRFLYTFRDAVCDSKSPSHLTPTLTHVLYLLRVYIYCNLTEFSSYY